MSVAARLRALGLHPKKRFGQNFLMDPQTARVIAEAATTPEGGTVLEIGAGLGALTRPLLDRASRIVAIERDRDLVPLLRADLDEAVRESRLEIVEGDALALEWRALLAPGPRPHVLAGNLPYQVTGALLERAVELRDAIDGAVFMVQAEVAERLAAAPGRAAYGALSVFVQAAYSVERVMTVRAGAFYPKPGVDSAVVRLGTAAPRRAVETDAFRSAVKAAFGMRRKTLRNAWRGLYGWSSEGLEAHAREAGISLDARGETLRVEDFAALARLAPKNEPR